MWQHFDILCLVLWKLHIKIHSYNNKWKFRHFVRQTSSYGPLNSATHIFTRLERVSPFLIMDKLAGSVVQNKSRSTILWYAEYWPVAHLLMLLKHIIIPNCDLPGNVDFICCASLLFTEVSRVTQNMDKFSGMLRSCWILFEAWSPNPFLNLNYMTNILAILLTFLQVIECSLQDMIQISQCFFL